MKWLHILPWSSVFGVRLHTISKLFFSSSALLCGGPIVICLVILLSNCTVHLSHISVVQSMLSPFTKSGLYMYITNNAFRYKVCNDLEPSLLVKGICHSRHLFKNYGLNKSLYEPYIFLPFTFHFFHRAPFGKRCVVTSCL